MAPLAAAGVAGASGHHRADLVGAGYRERPHYQRNDYLAWIGQGKREETRQNRLRKMLAELKAGGVYMGMKHAPSAKPKA